MRNLRVPLLLVALIAFGTAGIAAAAVGAWFWMSEPPAPEHAALAAAREAIVLAGPQPIPAPVLKIEEDGDTGEYNEDGSALYSRGVPLPAEDGEPDAAPIEREGRWRNPGRQGTIGDREEEKEADKPSPTGGSDCDQISGVTRHSESRYTLSQAFVDRYIRDQGQAQQQGGASWKKNKQRETVGIRLRSLRCAPRTAGLKNNDIIKSINGRAVTSTAGALLAYSDLKRSDSFSVKLRRSGKTMTIQYTVR
ncbi:MAG: hypothetical protein ACI8S6_000425 [Myxococcota bacterium]|jgi:hypothetical protein